MGYRSVACTASPDSAPAASRSSAPTSRLAISALEAPLKFRAPGITLALGLGIGWLVCHPPNLGEVALVAVLTAVSATSLRPGVTGWTLLEVA